MPRPSCGHFIPLFKRTVGIAIFATEKKIVGNYICNITKNCIIQIISKMYSPDGY